MADQPVTGVDVLRLTVKARNRSPHAITLIAREIGVAASTLENFVAGKVDLPVEKLKLLTKELHPGAEYDETLNLLRSANRAPPIPFGKPPPPFKPVAKTYKVGVLQNPGPQPVNPVKSEQPKSRPGWLPGGWV